VTHGRLLGLAVPRRHLDDDALELSAFDAVEDLVDFSEVGQSQRHAGVTVSQ
jgi:hypothetical protein